MIVDDNGYGKFSFGAKREKRIEFGALGLYIFSLRYLMSREY